MSDREKTKEPAVEHGSKAGKWLFFIGSLALLAAMAVDAIAVLGRHIGMPLWGSIELVQAAILIASSTAILSATLAKKHAKVRILVDRLKGRSLIRLQRIQAAFCVLFFCLLAAGSIWIFLDLRGGYEESELLHIPYAPLRIFCIVSMLGVIVNFLRRTGKTPPS